MNHYGVASTIHCGIRRPPRPGHVALFRPASVGDAGSTAAEELNELPAWRDRRPLSQIIFRQTTQFEIRRAYIDLATRLGKARDQLLQ